jgi:hypothetical protein
MSLYTEYQANKSRILKHRHILSFKNIFGRYQHFVEKYSVSSVQMTNDDIDN